jgi:2-[(L-alanin-3-ylcarbamoyl)methyl]-2-hydroxybutanedioate decarboxylase
MIKKLTRFQFVEETVKELKRQRKKPFCAYLYDLKGLQLHAKKLQESLPDQCQLFYAVKANADQNILRALLPCVHGFDIASLGEMKKVQAVSSTASMIFGGPGKTDGELEAAIQNDNISFIHVESLLELKRLNWLAQQNNVIVPILLRVNIQYTVQGAKLKMAGVPTQFGIDEKQIYSAIQMAKEMEYVQLLGFNFHAMSNNVDPNQHALFIKYCLQKTAQWEKDFRQQFSVVNVGGGVGINYENPDHQFEWELFIKRLRQVIEQHANSNWMILFELGRFLTAKFGYYATEVLDIKENHGKNFVILRGGSHHFRLPAAWKINHPFSVISIEEWRYPFNRPYIRDCEVTVVGELCTPNDVLAHDVFCPQIQVGDIVLFHYAGAYGWDISHKDFLSHPYPEFLYLT